MDNSNNRFNHIFNKVLEMSDDGFIVVDCNGIVTDINEKYCNFLNTTRKDAIGKTIFNIIPNSKMLDIVQNAYTEESVLHTYDSGEKVIVSRSFVKNDDDMVIAGVAQVKFKLTSLDVTKRLMEEYHMLNYYKEQYEALQNNTYDFNQIIGDNPRFLFQKQRGLKVAKTSFSVLLTGETGTGKEVFARAIHNSSERAKNPMVSINCAAIPSELLESELFGYEGGAFTGAKSGGKKGKFLMANNSTIFLDEVGDMPLPMQAKLLRVLEEKVIEPVGSTKQIPIDIRIISATRKNLQEMVLNGEFREDLFYRLNVVNIEILPLRERKDDILILSSFFLDRLNQEYRQKVFFSPEVELCFYSYDWPGNIRELDNVIKSAYAVCNEGLIMLYDLPKRIAEYTQSENNDEDELEYHSAMDQYEEHLIKYFLNKNNGNVNKAAESANIHRSLFYKKMKKYKLETYKYKK